MMLSKRTLERLKKEQDALPASFWEPMNKEAMSFEYRKAHNLSVGAAMEIWREKYLVDDPNWVAN